MNTVITKIIDTKKDTRHIQYEKQNERTNEINKLLTADVRWKLQGGPQI